MFGLGWSEMMVVGIEAMIENGPKDLTGQFLTLGQYTGNARIMAREFTKAMTQADDQAGIKEVSKTLNAAANPKKFGADKIKEATGMTKGPATTELSAERQAAKEKMSKAMGDAALARQAREAEEAAAKAAETATPESPAPEAKS